MSDQNKKEIIIDLGDSSNAKSFKVGNIIHQSALDKVISFINVFREANQIAKQEQMKNNKKHELSYKHNTITILGSRGSGKTSFLLSIKEAIESDKKYNDLVFLEMIDPTLVEEKGHVFLNVISSICDQVKEVLDKKEADSLPDSQCQKKHWKESMNKLAKGLPSIDGIGNSKFGEWQDAEFVMQNELQAIHSARNLAKYFADFVEQSLEILNKEQFILFFDDIDVDSSKGYAVLETIRKYFVSDKLISFLSGDLKLYDALVRDKKWNNFGTKLITFECSTEFQNDNRRQINMNHYNDIVTDLTSQYLIKIMQPKYRIHLSVLYDYFVNKNLEIKIQTSESNKKLIDFLKEIFKVYGISNDLQCNTFVEFLLRQPLRSVIHFLQSFVDSEDITDSSFVSIFLSDLYEKHVDINALQNSILYFIPNVLQTLVQEQKLRESYQLIPTTLDNSFNATLFTSSLLFSNHINNGHKFLVFEYFYKIAYLRNFINKEEDYKNLNTLLKTSGILTDNVFRDSCNQLQSSLYGAYDEPKKSNEFGVISLYSLHKIAKTAKSDAFYRIDHIFDTIPNDNEYKEFRKAIGFIPFYIGTSSRRNNGIMFYSLVSLLATIGEICKRLEDRSLNKENFYTTISELSQIRYYSISENNTRSSRDTKTDLSEPTVETDDKTNETDEDKIETIDNNIFVAFFSFIEEWGSSNISAVSPYLLGKIFTRFYYSLQVIGQDKNFSLGQLFNLQILAFFNAILIEEAREKNLNSISFNYNNIVGSEKNFIDNLKKVTESSEKNNLVVSKWFMTCPFLMMYIDEKIVQLIKEFVTSENYDIIANKYDNYEIHSLLNQVLIDGTKINLPVNNKWEEMYNKVKTSLPSDFVKKYTKQVYRAATLNKFFNEFRESLNREDFVGEEKEFIKYCLDNYSKDNGL
jgi:hypothetical protein